jgi:hypothetical protein
MGDSKAVDAVRSAVAALNNGDIDGYLGYLDPSCKRWVAGFAPKGQSIDVETCEVYELGGDLVVATWAYGNLGQLPRQIAAEEGDIT